MSRLAAIDIGTNSVRLLVADIDGSGREAVLVPVERRMRITRLGQGVDASRSLAPDAIDRTVAVLREYRAVIDDLGATKVRATATSAARDATNRDAFFGPAAEALGSEPELLSGEEEARLSFLGATSGLTAPSPFLVVDIGGGSTELQVVGTDVRVSLDVGCVRLTERFGDDVEAVRASVRGLLPEAEAKRAVGVAGTVTTIAALDLGLAEYDPERIHGHRISKEGAGEQLARLASLTVEERAQIVEPGRAPVIVAGAAILAEILDFYGLDAIEASERDILHGAALAAAELPARVEGDAPPGAYTCC